MGAAALSLAIVFALIIVAAPAGQAQSFTVLHNFTDGTDGAYPQSGVARDAAGNLYGTASSGGAGYGTVYKLTPKNGSWVFAPLYQFAGGNDGANPVAPVMIGPNGSLYGTTYEGGGSGCGTVFNLRPEPMVPLTPLTPWVETMLHRFQCTDGEWPPYGDLVFDHAGNIYGTTSGGGTYDSGTVFKLTPSNGAWTESVLYSFDGGSGGGLPDSGVVLDSAGNLYGTVYGGFSEEAGGVYELTPSGSGWVEQVLHSFDISDGADPMGGLIFDQSGNLYGTTTSYGPGGRGTVFELSPSGGGWTLTTLSGSSGSLASLTMDASGNLYGTGDDGAYGFGNVFRLTRSNGGWTYTSLHDFTGGSDGAYPWGGVTLDAHGNLWSTAWRGGAYGYGDVFEITP
ncbi:MAG: choice-of-anchor tandem repeat GloVer-containing protein [Candidatus Korobacteraceae bacterium]|jgi:uncharacterized repeat protein (TIGR03803 family)